MDDDGWKFKNEDESEEEEEEEEGDDEDEDEDDDDDDGQGLEDPCEGDNNRLQQRFMDIFNDVLLYFGLNNARKAMATQPMDDEKDDIFYRYDYRDWARGPPRFSTRPDLVVLGEDSRQLPRPLSSYHRGMSVSQEGRD